jgi:hypothetical protein
MHHWLFNLYEARLRIAEFSQQTLAPMTISPSSLPNATKDGLAMIDISKLTAAKMLDKRSSPCAVEHRCELEPPWLAADGRKERAWEAFGSGVTRTDFVRAGWESGSVKTTVNSDMGAIPGSWSDVILVCLAKETPFSKVSRP